MSESLVDATFGVVKASRLQALGVRDVDEDELARGHLKENRTVEQELPVARFNFTERVPQCFHDRSARESVHELGRPGRTHAQQANQ